MALGCMMILQSSQGDELSVRSVESVWEKILCAISKKRVGFENSSFCKWLAAFISFCLLIIPVIFLWIYLIDVIFAHGFHGFHGFRLTAMCLKLHFMLLYEDLTYKIRGAIFKVYNYWGPGLFEQIYEESLVCELRKEGLMVEHQKSLPVIYDGQVLPCDYRLDLLVENKVIIELKSVEELRPVHYKQLMTYLRIANKRVGFLVNFNVADMSLGIHRVVM